MVPDVFGHAHTHLAGGRARTAATLVCCIAATVFLLMTFGDARADRRSFSNEELTDGFLKTVFGVEYPASATQQHFVRKYQRPVRVAITDLTPGNTRDRRARHFVAALNRQISGLDIGLATERHRANFQVFIVNRADYADVVRERVYANRSVPVLGRCMVRVIANRNGILRSQAVIVADEGDFVFERCLTEEILQGLGPLNDDPSLQWSVFNDFSSQRSFTTHDRFILNMLYHRTIRPGMTEDEALAVLPDVLRDVRRVIR